MKVETVNGVLTARAENLADIQALMVLTKSGHSHTKVRKYKKQVSRVCPVAGCGKHARGAVGLGIHMHRTHCISADEREASLTAKA